MDPMIRPAARDEIGALQQVEVEAGARFRDIGLGPVADDLPPADAELLVHIRRGTAWVAVLDEEVVGYALASEVDGQGHLHQVSVHPSRAGRGIGAALIAAVHQWATDEGYAEVSLTTYDQVPWNAPYYRRLGYRDIPDEQLGPDLAAIRQQETASGLDISPRVAMRHVLGPLPSKTHELDPSQRSGDLVSPSPITWTGDVSVDWIDYNGHMSEGFYGLVFGRATDEYLLRTGFDADYRAQHRSAFYTVETHISFLDELALGTSIAVRTAVAGVDTIRLHLFHELIRSDDQAVAATQESLLLHVDTTIDRVGPMTEGVFAVAAADAAAHSASIGPDQLGKRIHGPRG